MHTAGPLIHAESQPCYCSVFGSCALCRDSPNRHLGPVWQLRWTQQEVSSTGEEKVEALLSVGADGRISKWFSFKDGLDCIGTQQPAQCKAEAAYRSSLSQDSSSLFVGPEKILGVQ